MLPAMGVVVLRSDRRRMSEDRDAPYLPQVEDLTHGLDLLGKEIRPVPTGLWGFSQGAWAALLASAGEPAIAFLILVGSAL
jgi:pimeloyl-ACP methyl ester carboxylesterase